MSPRLREDYSFDNGAGRHEKYDYDKILNGQVWQCFPKEDFHGKSSSFAQSCYTAARRRGIRARCRIQHDGSVIVQAYDPNKKANLSQTA